MPFTSLLFVPDISGFTQFINNTEIEHSQHIISELLEIIISENHLDFEISEVEGDAVVFYKNDNLPSVSQVYEQARAMFLKFHAHLKLYDQQRICQCGACSSASKLSLKFIVHSGALGFTNIQNRKKPFGADMVLAHKLLKNNVKQPEYVLITDSFLQHHPDELDKIKEATFSSGTGTYPDIGAIGYKYASLKHLFKLVPKPGQQTLPAKSKKPIVQEHVFDLPIMETYEYLSNFELKKIWNKDVKEFKYDPHKVNRIGTRHICVFDGGKAEFESVTNDFGKGNMVYGEKLLTFPLARDITFYFILTALGDHTKVRIEVHYQPLPFVGWLLEPIIIMNVKKINQKFINSFSKLNRQKKDVLSATSS